MPIGKWTKTLLLFGLAMSMAGCQLSTLVNNASKLSNTTNLSTPAHITVKAPLSTPGHYRTSAVGYVVEVPIANAKVFCVTDPSITGTTDKDGRVTLQVPNSMAGKLLMFQADPPENTGLASLSCFAQLGEQHENNLGTASTLLVTQLDNEMRQFGKVLKDSLASLDVAKTEQMVQQIESAVVQNGGVSAVVAQALQQGNESGLGLAALFTSQEAGVSLVKLNPLYATPEAVESFASDDFFPLIQGGKWEYALYSNSVSGSLIQEMTDATSGSATSNLKLTYTLPGQSEKTENLSVALTKAGGSISLVPSGDKLAGLSIPAINGSILYTGLEKNKTWNAYASVNAVVLQCLPTYQVRGNAYSHVVRIAYSGTDNTGKPLSYEEYRAKDVGLIKLVRTDYTSLELVKLTRP